MDGNTSWKGYLKVSLVSCPIRLYPAASERERIHLHLINPATGHRIKMITVDAESGDEVPRAELVKGYEYGRGKYATVTKDELAAIQLESTRTVDIERFVKAETVDRIYFDTPYYVAPDGKVAQDAYKVIAEAMREQELAGIGRAVIAQRERPLILEPRDEGLMATTLRTADEIRDDDDAFAGLTNVKADPKMVEMARAIMEKLEGPFDPTMFTDRYEQALRALVERKVHGLPMDEAGPAHKGAEVIDLMDALKRSLGKMPGRKHASTLRQATRTRRGPKRRAHG